MQVYSAQLYVDPTRWDRFLWHAAFVRSICHRTHDSSAIEDTSRLLIQAVLTQNGGRTVLPLLRSIQWLGRDSAPSDGTLIPFFASTLRHARFTKPNVLLLRRLRESSPLLESIFLPHLGPSLVQELLRFHRLRAAQVSRISQPEPFKIIVAKPNLISLGINKVVGPWPDPGHVVSVRDLRVLTLASEDVIALSGLFNTVRFQTLETVNVHVMYASQRLPDIVTFISAFGNSVSASSLQNFNLALVGLSSRPPDVTLPAFRDLFALFLPLGDLRTFNLICLLETTSTDDADIEALARAWPKLERLHINRGSTSESGVSMSALHHLSIWCPRLRELSLPGLHYPTIGIHEIPAPPPDRSPSHPLRHLRVRTLLFPEENPPYISDKDAEALARYLLDLFPRLDGWKYKPATPRHDPSAPDSGPDPEPSRSRTFINASAVSTDTRWPKIAGHIYAICSAHEVGHGAECKGEEGRFLESFSSTAQARC